MGIGLGVLLVVAGLILVTDTLTLDLEFVRDDTLGWILLLGGVVSLVASLAMARNRRTEITTHKQAR